jgi:O-antigen ligase
VTLRRSLRSGSGQAERFTFNPPSASATSVIHPVASAFRRKEAETGERRDWAFTWTLIFTAVLFLRPQDIFAPLGALHLAEVSATLGLISLFTGRLAKRQTLSRVTPELVGVLVFGAVILLTAPFSIWFGGAIGVFQELYVKVVLVYLLAVNVLVSPTRLRKLTWVLILVLGYLASRAIFDYARGVNLVSRGTRVMGSVGGIMQNPNDLAMNMVVFLPFAALLAMQPGSLFKRLVAAACGVSMIGAIVASGSRGGFLGFAVMMAVLAVVTARKRPAFVLAGVVALICALPLVPDSYWRRIASITDESKDDVQSSQARKRLMGESWDAFVQNPITGVGAGQFKDWNPQGREEAWHEAHNVWLQVAAELGVFGVGAFLFLAFRAFYAVFQTRRLLSRRRGVGRRQPVSPAPGRDEDDQFLDAHSAAMAASMAGWFVCAFFGSIAYNWTFYYLLAFAAAPRDILRGSALAARTVAVSAGPRRLARGLAAHAAALSTRKARA